MMNIKLYIKTFLKQIFFYKKFKHKKYNLFYYPVKKFWYFITSSLVMFFLFNSCSIKTKVVIDKKLKMPTYTESTSIENTTTTSTEEPFDSIITTVLKSTTPPLITSITPFNQSIIFYKSSMAYSSSTFTVSCNEDGYINIIDTNNNSIVLEKVNIVKNIPLDITITGIDLYNANTTDGLVNLKIQCVNQYNLINSNETILQLTFQSTPPFTYYWISDEQGNWNDENNWSFFPMIPTKTSIPDNNTDVVFDGSANGDCIINESNITVNNILVHSGYTGFLDAQTYNPSVKVLNNAVFKGKKFYMGNGLWEVGNSFDIETVEYFNPGLSTLKLFGEGIIKGNNAAIKDFHNLIITGNITTANNIAIYNGYVHVYGIFTINHYFQKQNGNYLKILGNAQIQGTGTLYIKDGISEFSPDATLSVANLSVGDDALMAPGTYGSSFVDFWRTSGSRTITFKHGKFIFLGNVRFNANNNGSLPYTYTINNLQNPSFEFHGNLTFKDPQYLIYNRGSGSIIFSQATNQQIKLGNKTVEDIFIKKSSSISEVQILDDFICKNLFLSSGKLILNSKSITTQEDFVIYPTAAIDPISLAGSTLNVNGNFYAAGSSTNILTFNAQNTWTLNVTGAYALATYINIDYVNNISTPLVVNAATSIIGANNTNMISKTPQIRYWISTTLGNWSNPANWSNQDGGSGGFSPPTYWDNVYFTSNGSGDCMLDTNIFIHKFNFYGYSGIFDTNNYNLVITGELDTSGTINMGNLNTWTTYNRASFRRGTINYQTATVIVRGINVVFETQLNILYKVIHDYGSKTYTSWGWGINILDIKGELQGGNCCNYAYQTTVWPSGQLDHPWKVHITIKRLINNGRIDTKIALAGHGDDCSIQGYGEFNNEVQLSTPWNNDYICTINSNLSFNSDFIIRKTGWSRSITIDNRNNYNITFKKNVLFDENNISIIWQKGNGKIMFTGDADQSVNFSNKSIESLLVQKNNGVITFTENINTVSFQAQSGAISFNSITLNVSGDLNILSPSQVIASSLPGTTINVNGNLYILGDEQHIIDLAADYEWFLNVNGQSLCKYVKTSSSRAGINPINAIQSLNLGDNTNWIFE